jgi:hypothetical protein
MFYGILLIQLNHKKKRSQNYFYNGDEPIEKAHYKNKL